MTKLGAVIVETRPLPNLVEIIYSHMMYLPEDCGLRVYCSQDNIGMLVREGDFSTDQLKLLDRPINNQNDYNSLLTDINFWKQMPFERVLIFQPDSKILRTGIEKFAIWDLVGSPWSFQEHGGNGGISWRGVKVMIDIIEKYGKDYQPGNPNEDVWFSNIMFNDPLIGDLAPRHICEEFGCESIFRLNTYCVHSIEKYLTPEQCNQIYTQYE